MGYSAKLTKRQTRAAEELTGLAQIASERAPQTVERVLSAAREHLGMEVAYVAQFTEGKQVYRYLGGDTDSFGLIEGEGIPLQETFCKRMVEGRLPNAVPNAKTERLVKDLTLTREADIGCYIGVPLRFSDGRLYGSFCCMSHSPEPSLHDRDVKFMKVLARLVAEQLERDELEAKRRELAIEAAGLQALLAAIEARDSYTNEHSRSVLELATEVAREMGLTEEEVHLVRDAALLHDVGKIAVPDSILRKPGPLDNTEWKAMQEHAEVGARMVASVKCLAHLAPLVRATHERWDGKGYPDGLEGEEIPLASRIVHACDAWHAMTSERPYREALSTEGAIEELEKNAGVQFDPRVVVALLEILKTRRLLPDEESEPQSLV